MRRPLSSWILAGSALTAALAAVVWLPARGHWRTDATARRLVRAMQQGDSISLQRLSARGTAQPSLCLCRYWPRAFWFRDGGLPTLTRVRRGEPDRNLYRVVGDVLHADTVRAVWEFWIAEAPEPKLTRFFADSRLGVWTPAVYACLER